MKHSIAFAGFAVLLLCHSVSYASIEAWSNDNDAEGWYAHAGVISVGQDPVEDNLRWQGDNGFLMDAILADSSSSGGAFVGDLIAKGGLSYGFDLLVDDGSDLFLAQLELFNQASNDDWRFILPSVTPGLWQHHELPLTAGAGWEQVGGANSFQWMLGNVDVVGLVVAEGWVAGAGASGRLDNFELTIPEPQTFAMFTVAALIVLAWPRRRTDLPGRRARRTIMEEKDKRSRTGNRLLVFGMGLPVNREAAISGPQPS